MPVTENKALLEWSDWHISEGRATDGRLLRGERTRIRVLEALLALLEEGQVRPTAQEVADRAEVALRTIYHHFEDAEGLRRTALDLQMSRCAALLGDIDPELPLETRIREVTKRLRHLFDAITPIRRTALLDEQLSEEFGGRVRRIQQVRRQFIERAFAPELDALGSGRLEMLDAIDVTTSWPKWHYLRGALNYKPLAAERLIALMLRSLLAPSEELSGTGAAPR